MQQSSSPLSVSVYRDLSAKRGGSVVRPHHCSLLWSSKSDPHAKRDSGILTLSPCSQLVTVLLLLPQWRFALSPRPGKDGLRALLSPSGRRRVPLHNGKGLYIYMYIYICPIQHPWRFVHQQRQRTWDTDNCDTNRSRWHLLKTMNYYS